MKVNVLGIQSQDYTSRRTGNPVKGLSLHCSHPDARVQGLAVSSIFISANLPCYHKLVTVTPGWVVNVEFDQRGSVVDADILELMPQYKAPDTVPGPQPGTAKK